MWHEFRMFTKLFLNWCLIAFSICWEKKQSPGLQSPVERELTHEPAVHSKRELKRLQHISVPRTWNTPRVNKHNHHQNQGKTEMIINI